MKALQRRNVGEPAQERGPGRQRTAPPGPDHRHEPDGSTISGPASRLLALAAQELVPESCGHDPEDDLPEACWRHPEAGLLCPRCALRHHQDADLHPWPDDLDDEICDVCGPFPTPALLVDVAADLSSALHPWPPRTQVVSLVYGVGGRSVRWPIQLCGICLHAGSPRP